MTALADLPWPRRTERLALRPATPADAEACWRYNQRPEVGEWRGAPGLDRGSFTARFVERLDGQLVAELDGRVVGDLSVRTRTPWAQEDVVVDALEADLGWAFDPAEQGRGLATEAVRELLAVAFDGLGVRRVVAYCFVANEASWRLMERVGLRREAHTVDDGLHRSGVWHDGYGYALLAEEWRGRPADGAPPRPRPSLDQVAWPRRTERLLVRRATADDVPAVWAWSDDPRVSEWESAVQHDEASFAARWAHPARLPRRLVVEEDGAVVGELMLDVGDGEAQAEVEGEAAGCEAVLGWSFAAAVHGRGLATEATADLLRVAFDELGVRRVTASCFAGNDPSWRLMERLGMRREQHVVAGALHRTRGWVDGYAYALLAEEWRSRPPGWAPPGRRPSLAELAWPRRTERLVLRRATPADAPAAWAYNRLPAVTEWLTLDADEAAFAARWSSPPALADRIVVERDGTVVGDVTVRVGDTFAQDDEVGRSTQAALGWTIDPAHQGRGYATEVAAELLAICFDGLCVRRAFAQCQGPNVASWKVMEKVGMRREWDNRAGTHHRTRGWVDAYEYAVLADEWRSAEAPERET